MQSGWGCHFGVGVDEGGGVCFGEGGQQMVGDLP